MSANKIQYGLSNVYYAKLSYDQQTSKYTYETPKKIPGGVNVTFAPAGSQSPFYADNITYYNAVANSGYTGTLEIANIPDDFRTEILNEVTDENGVMLESSDTQPSEFALLFQFEGDVKAKRHVFYRCSVTRPNVDGETQGESITPKTSTLNITVMARENDHFVKGTVMSDEASYENWFTAIVEPKPSKDD